MANIQLRYGRSSVKLSLDNDYVISALIPKGLRPLSVPKNVIRDVLRYPLGTRQISETIKESDTVSIELIDVPKKLKDTVKKLIEHEVENIGANIVSRGGSKHIYIATSSASHTPQKPQNICDIYIEFVLDLSERPCAVYAGSYRAVREQADEILFQAVSVKVPTTSQMVIAAAGEKVNKTSDVKRALMNSLEALDEEGILIFLSSKIRANELKGLDGLIGSRRIIWIPMKDEKLPNGFEGAGNLAEALNMVEENYPCYVIPDAYRTVPTIEDKV